MPTRCPPAARRHPTVPPTRNPRHTSTMNYNNYCIILAGGRGRRLWPASRESRPKQFIDFLGTGRTLLQLTYDRVSQFIPQDNIYVCTNAEYADLTRQQLPVLTDDQILCEPAQLSTAPIAAWASWLIGRRNPSANILVTPSDQVIQGEAAYARELLSALDFVATHEEFLAIGVTAREPNTAYGYIQKGTEVGRDLYEVKTFTEKPPVEYAATFVRSGEFLWNTGIFLWNVATMRRLEADLVPGLSHQSVVVETRSEEIALAQVVLPAAQRTALDGFLLEGQHMIVRDCSFGWSDVGSWPVMRSVLPHTADGNAYVITPRISAAESGAATAPAASAAALVSTPSTPAGGVIFKGTRDTIVSVPEGVAAIVRGLDGFLVALEGNVLIITPNDDPARMRRYSAELQVKYGEEFL